MAAGVCAENTAAGSTNLVVKSLLVSFGVGHGFI